MIQLGLRSALLHLVVVLTLGSPALAEDEPAARYELYLSPTLDAETGARLVASAVTGTGAGEERLFRPLGSGPGGIAARELRTLVWDAPMAWWFGVALHEAFGHGGRAREFNASPGVHLGSPWGGRDSYASFDLAGTSSEERLYIYIGGAEANTLAATLLERRAVEGVRMRPIELLYLLSNRLVASDTREIVQKLVQGVAAFQIVVKGLDRHPSADKDGSSTEDIGVTVNNTLLTHVQHSGLWYLSIHQRVVGA